MVMESRDLVTVWSLGLKPIALRLLMLKGYGLGKLLYIRICR